MPLNFTLKLWFILIELALILIFLSPLFSSSCPLKCKCKTATRIDCSRKGLLAPPSPLSPGIRELNMLRSNIHTLYRDSFANLTKLEKLKLTKSNIAVLEASTFAGLIHLRELQLDSNLLTVLPVNVFSSLYNLTTLDLSKNKFILIPNIVLPVNLRKLYLNFNEITSAHVPSNMDRKNNKLIRFMLSDNKISELGEDDFLPLGKMNVFVLTLARNSIKRIHSNTFNSLKKLVILDLAFNSELGLSQVAKVVQSIARYKKLQHLHLADVGLTKLPEDFFLPFNGTNLVTLDLSGNSLEITTSRTWHFLTRLKILKLNGAMLTKIEFNNKTLQKLYTLELHGNQLTDIPKLLPPSLKDKLRLSGNLIQSVPFESFRKLTSLQNLDLSANRIHSIEDKAFIMLRNLRRLNLGKNSLERISTNCFVGLNNLTHLQLNGQVPTLSDISSTSFSLPALRYLDLKDNNLQLSPPTSPFELMPQLNKLLLSSNSISKISFSSFKGLSNLRELDLSGNGISSWSQDVLRPFANTITKLDLEFNNISIISLSTEVGTINSIGFLKALKTANFYGNPFNCSCSIKWPKLTFSTIVFTKLRGYRCAVPKSKKSLSLIKRWEEPCQPEPVSTFDPINPLSSQETKRKTTKLYSQQPYKLLQDIGGSRLSTVEPVNMFPSVPASVLSIEKGDEDCQMLVYIIIGLVVVLAIFIVLFIVTLMILIKTKRRSANSIPLGPMFANGGANSSLGGSPNKRSPSHPLIDQNEEVKV